MNWRRGLFWFAVATLFGYLIWDTTHDADCLREGCTPDCARRNGCA
jgi:hypothetical protein